VRRTATLLLALAATVLAAAGLHAASGSADSSYTFDAIFDDARGLVPGQVIKIAGARAGTIDRVTLTTGFKARLHMTVPARFGPFHSDATCTIRPEGLIAENFVECDPGTPGKPALQPANGRPATVAVSHTTEPVSLLDLFNIANAPTRDRFSVIVNELGIGLSGNGENLNDIILRADPALASARRVLAALRAERRDLGTVITASDRTVAALAGRTPSVERFLSEAARVTSVTAAHGSALSSAVHRLPGLLSVAQPALAHLDGVASSGAPLLKSIRTSLPDVNRLTKDLGPFAKSVTPALRKLAPVINRGTRTATDARPLLQVIAAYAHGSLANALTSGRLFASLQQRGFSEAFLSTVYYLAAVLSRFDGTSHLAAPALSVTQCSTYATKPVPGCGAHTGTAGNLLDYLLR
jgi:virulence factor Mce-like protein